MYSKIGNLVGRALHRNMWKPYNSPDIVNGSIRPTSTIITREYTDRLSNRLTHKGV